MKRTALEKRLIKLLIRLLEWEYNTGGWEDPVWRDAVKLAKELVVDNPEHRRN